MKRMDVQKLLAASQPSLWRFSALRDSEHIKVLWLSVANLHSKGLVVGLTDDGYWVEGIGNRVIRFSEEIMPVPLLPCLERPQAEVASSLVAGLEAAGLSQEISEYFPFERIVLCGLNIGLDSWAALSLQWLETMPPSKKLADALSVVTNSKWASQKVRHAAKRLLKSWRRNHPEFVEPRS